MNIEPGKGAQQPQAANRNPVQVSEPVYHKGRKIAHNPTEGRSQHSGHVSDKYSDRRLSEYSITSIDPDEGYLSETGSDIEEVSERMSFEDINTRPPLRHLSSTASIDSGYGYLQEHEVPNNSDVFSPLDGSEIPDLFRTEKTDPATLREQAYVRSFCDHSEQYINKPAFEDESHIQEPMFWTDSLAQQLKAIAVNENRQVSMNDYRGVYETEKVSLLVSRPPLYHSGDIKERLDQINKTVFEPDKASVAKLPNQFRWTPSLAINLLKHCHSQGKEHITLDDYLDFSRQEQSDLTPGRKPAGRFLTRKAIEEKLEVLNRRYFSAMPEKATAPLNTRAAQAFSAPTGNSKLEKGLLAGAFAGAATSGASVATASALQPSHDPGRFDHILQKDTPIDQMVILAQHNAGAVPGQGSLPLLATNQTMTIEDTLDKTPIRGFDLDLHKHQGEIVLNHGGLFDSTVSDDNIPKLGNILQTMNKWLDKPDNSDEVLFLNFENRENLPRDALENAFGPDAVLNADEYNHMLSRLGRAPTIEEIRGEGFKVVDFNRSRFIEAGSGETGFHTMPLESVWEDRTLMENGVDLDLEVGGFSTDDIAPHISTEQIDEFVNSGKGMWVSMDQVSPDDPRFFKPEDRDELALNPDLKLMGLFYQSDEAFQSALLGLGTATAGATAALALAGGAYQGFLNEKKIRNQDKLMPGHLKAMELTAILQQRKSSKKHQDKPLGRPITPEEIKNLYKKNQLKTITKDTLMAGTSATVSLTGSALALGMLFPPLMPAFGGVSAGVAGTGAISTILATVGNRKRLDKAIEQAFDDPGVNKALEKRVAAMNDEIRQCATQSGDVDELLSSMVSKREEGERLLKASTVMLGTSLVARASGMSKYGLPALGTAAMGVGGTITGVLVGLSAAMNYRERHDKLKNLAQTTSEVLRPDYGRKQKRKLGLFGDTAFQRFLNKNRESVIKDLGLKPGCSKKDIAFAFSLPENKVKLESYLRRFAKKEWHKDLTQFAKHQKTGQSFEEIRKDPSQLKPLLKKYAIKRVGDFAHNDTFAEGRSGTLKLALIGFFSGIFFLPMLAVGAGILGIGLGVSKAMAVRERQLFTRQLTELMDQPPGDDPEKIAAHNSINGMVDSWAKLLAVE